MFFYLSISYGYHDTDHTYLCTVIDSTRLQRDTASVSMDLLDRFLCTDSHRATHARANRKEYQLAAMTCLYIAVKIYEPFELDANLMSRLSRGIHSAEEITALEYEILVSLQWKLANPTPFQFVNYLLSLLPESAKPVAPLLYENSHFQTELAAGDYAFACIKSSTVAVASILNSMGSALGGVDQSSPAFNECVQYIREISRAFELDIDSPLVNAVRERLLNAFAKQSGYELSQGVVNVLSQPQDPSSKESSPFEESPQCVAKEAAISLDI